MNKGCGMTTKMFFVQIKLRDSDEMDAFFINVFAASNHALKATMKLRAHLFSLDGVWQLVKFECVE